ncbi:tetratricopeptide repeat protein [uncultured Tenacibaculum sp.]|uniref:tetratricopeptide repeat protein n=1 Tax=uncultured Tenacibaculum sp. TaxID=174713 RepID=UPI0026248828|nr:tetratricopeptide repeat protein [uncultured Tenacibaculum sp.]
MRKSIVFIFLIQSLLLYSQEIDTTLVRLEHNIKIAATDSLKIEALLEISEYQKRRDFNKVKEYYNAIHTLLKNVNYDKRRQKAKALSQLGIYQRRKSNYIAAYENYLIAKNIFTELNDSSEIATLFHNIAMVNRFQKEYKKSIQYFKKAIEINTKKNRIKALGNNYNMMSGSYKRLNKLDSAFYVISKAIIYFDLDNNYEGKQQALSNKATLLGAQGNHQEALTIYLNYLEYVKKIKKKRSIISTQANIASSYLRLKEYEKALSYVNNSIDLADKEQSRQNLHTGYVIRSKIYKAMDEYDLALKDVVAYTEINNEIFNLKNTKKLKEIEILYKQEQQRLKDSIFSSEEQKLLVIEAKNQKLQKQLYAVFLLISILIISVSILYITRYLRKKKVRLKEMQLSTEIKQLDNELFPTEKESRFSQNETILDLERKENLANLKPDHHSISLEQIVSDLRSSNFEEEKIILLKKHLTVLHKDYIKLLKTTHPSLTKTDLEICSYVKIGLSRTEIANLRNTSLEAVKSTRFRLKKKLNLGKETALNDYLLSIKS